MNAHQHFEDWLPLYVSGELDSIQREEMEQHLESCPACRADLRFWQSVSHEVVLEETSLVVPLDLPEKVFSEATNRSSLWGTVHQALDIVKYQVPLVRSDLWPASAAMMLIGVVVAIVANKMGVLYFLAPMLAAATLAAIYGPENDEACELTCATKTSPWKILLARLALVFSYDLLLGLAASLVLSLVDNSVSFWPLVLAWLGPMAFLSILALVFSMWMGTGKAISIVYTLWLLQYIPFSLLRVWATTSFIVQIQEGIREFWKDPILLFASSGIMLLVALLSCHHPNFSSNNVQTV